MNSRAEAGYGPLMVHRPLRLRLDGDALVSNWRWLRERGGGAACGAAVKADGYGLGAGQVVERLAAAGCRDFFVTTWAEAEALMPWSPGLNLSVLHGVGQDDLEAALSSPARPVLNSPRQVARWRESGQGRPCDVMVDTGMNRLGLTPEEARSGLLDGLRVQTLMSHLACADEPDHPMNERQLSAFRALRQSVPAQRYSLSNSAGICLGPKYAFGLTRPGLALYGGIPVRGSSEQERGLRRVMSLQAQVVQVREISKGSSVGYGATFTAGERMKAAIINIGYADGYLRQLGERGFARSGKDWLPILGRISMDLIVLGLSPEREVTTIQIGGGPNTKRWEPAAEVTEGDWVDLNSDLADLAGPDGALSQYELLTTLGSRYERMWS